jgi:hypothetical protein
MNESASAAGLTAGGAGAAGERAVHRLLRQPDGERYGSHRSRHLSTADQAMPGHLRPARRAITPSSSDASVPN